MSRGFPAARSVSQPVDKPEQREPVPPVTFSVPSLPLNASALITPIGANVSQLNVSTDPLGARSVSDILITATGPNGTQQIDVSLQIDQIG